MGRPKKKIQKREKVFNFVSKVIDLIKYKWKTAIKVTIFLICIDMQMESVDYVLGKVQDTYWEFLVDNDSRSDYNKDSWKISINVYDDEEKI